MFSKDRFTIDLDTDTVTCPAGVTIAIRRGHDGGGLACFASACAACPLRERCTTAAEGRTIRVGPYEQALARARQRQADPAWQADYRATRPKVERKLAHLMRRKHGGRRARVRGTIKIDADFRLLAAAANLARLAVLGLRSTPTGWAAAPA
jgi:DDE family transposase